jgi:hypothetical protein
MRVICFLMFVCGVITANLEAQPLSKSMNEKEAYSVTLHGQVEAVELSNVSSSGVSLVVKLKLELLNNGTKPVIFLATKPPSLVGAALAKSPGDLTSGKVLVSEYTGEAVNTSSEWLVLRRSLNQPSPPPAQVRIMKPNESWQFEDSITIALPTESGRNNFFPQRESWESIRKLSTVWLRVSSQVWSLNLEPIGGDRTKKTFGRKLQRRWKNVGLLWLDSIQSEPIMLDLQKIPF